MGSRDRAASRGAALSATSVLEASAAEAAEDALATADEAEAWSAPVAVARTLLALSRAALAEDRAAAAWTNEGDACR